MSDRPNVVLVLADDLGYSDLGCYGGEIETPNLDRLGRSGVRLGSFYNTARCSPSRASLLTGIRPSTSGVYHNSQPWRQALPDAVTLPQHFMAAGYTVHGGGKIFHGSYPDRASWQEYYSQPHDPAAGPKKKKARRDDAPPRPFDWGPLDIDDQEMADAKVADWAVAELSRKADKPFFLAVGIYKPHLQWFVAMARWPTGTTRPVLNRTAGGKRWSCARHWKTRAWGTEPR